MMAAKSRSTQRMATEPMVNFVRSLLARRDTSSVPDLVRIVTQQLNDEALTFATASSAIDVLKALPVVQVIADRDRDARDVIKDIVARIPDGYYALEDENEAGTWKFYRVDQPTTGRWKRFTFLKIQAGDDFYPIKNLQIKAYVLSRIATNPRQAAVNYGKKIGRCWKCHRTLTNPESVKQGLGPCCAQKVGW